MKTFFIFISILTVLLAGATQLSARLSETRSQCEARYGHPFEESKASADIDRISYKKNGLIIVIFFIRGYAEAVAYIKESGEFNDADVKRLLEVNEGTPSDAMEKGWLRIGRNDSRVSKVFSKTPRMAWIGNGARLARVVVSNENEGGGHVLLKQDGSRGRFV